MNAMAALGKRTGVGHYTVELTRALRQAGVSIVEYPHPCSARLRNRLVGEVRPAASGGSTHSRPFWRRVVRAPFRWGWRAWIEFETRQAFRPRHVDLYHEPNFFPIRTNIPTVVTVHDLSAVLHPEWHPTERAEQFARDFLPRVPGFAHILTDSDAARDEILRTLHLPAERVTRAYPGVRESLRPIPGPEVAATVARLGLPRRFFLHVGTLEPRKNLLMLVKAYSSLPSTEREQCPLVLVGPWGWRFEELAAFFDAEARHRNVIHLGYVRDEDLPALYNAAQALVFPTWYEGFGLPAAEMLACGGAVLGSSTPAVAEVLAGRGTLINPADADAWRAAMSRAIREPDWVESLKIGARERAAEFTWAHCARDTLAGYRAALTSASRTRHPH